jgi:formylmethanofuran dehydrogenase subunit E
MCVEKSPWEKAVEFHGHICPGLAMGFRATELALEALGSTRSSDEEMIAIVENNACGVDAVQIMAGCSFGKGNLFFRDLGKQVYTFARRKDGSAVRVSVRYGSLHDPGFHTLRARINSGQATEEERERYRSAFNQRIREILSAGPDVFEVKRVNIELPARASIYQTVQCAECGEGVMEPRARLKNGKVVCIPCFQGDK